MVKRAIITGGTGFLGFHLAKNLVSQGWKIGFVVRLQSDLTKIKNLASSEIFIFNDNPEELAIFFNFFCPDVVFHLASCVIVDHDILTLKNLIDSNILFGTYLLEAMIKVGCKKIINAGSFWQHFNNEKNNPVNLYAATKSAFYEIINYYYHALDFQVVNLELFDTYGPGDSRRKIINLLLDSLIDKKFLELSPGLQKLNFVYVDDVVNAFLIAAEQLLCADKKQFYTFTVEGDEAVSLKEIVAEIEFVSGQKLPVSFGKRNYRDREVMTPWSKGVRLPSWKAKVSLREGLSRAIRFISEKTCDRVDQQK